MKTRVISGLCMVPLLAFVYLGGYWLTAMCILIALMGVKELFQGFEAMDIKPSLVVAYGSTVVLYLINGFFPMQHEFILAWLAASIMASSIYIFKINERKVEDAMATMLGIIYVVFFSYHVTLVDQTQEYANLVWVVLLSAFATDIFAYFSGYLFGRHGRHKLCPNLSPKKTWEGAIGGTLGSIICCGLFGYFVMPRIWVHCLMIGAVCAILSQCGDLTASAYKRKMGIKDYGTLIPGHGGIMDRFDSVLFTAPVVYYYIVLVLQ
ncbi:MAG: phosphatidate cytidylyltransferase [Firmicutes bacterium]|nr:phosphatidate cytidylyltransferase [Bacillota bacterium]